MERITITIPAEMKAYIEQQVSGGRYANTSEFLRDLIRHDEVRQANKIVEELLMEGIRSGKAGEWKSEEMQAHFRETIRKAADRRQAEAS